MRQSSCRGSCLIDVVLESQARQQTCIQHSLGLARHYAPPMWMVDMREGCAAAVKIPVGERSLIAIVDPEQAADLLWTLLPLRTGEHLSPTCGWDGECYIDTIRGLTLVALAQDVRALRDVLAHADSPA